MQPAVEIKKLSVKKGNAVILHDINLTIPSGSIVGVLGPSGAGKTTLFRTIVGRQKPTHGHVTVLGKRAGSHALRKQVGYMTQLPSMYSDLTVYENLRYFASLVGVPKARIHELLEQLSLTPQAHQVGATLSGGQKSRLSLAIALLSSPPLLVLDEPTVGIDPILRHELWRHFKQLAATGTTLLISSHVMDEASHCDHLLLIHDGEILATGTEAQLRTHTHTATLEDAFIKLIEGAPA
ncbi:MAG TPA: heme ABC exporter ATP-binding protein CcmA [Candidatus Saccharimonadales bacterium]|nr:heme ABC exporter ATP-binding protein CcmA [Candidatus Saccharimonadales bacterium]